MMTLIGRLVYGQRRLVEVAQDAMLARDRSMITVIHLFIVKPDRRATCEVRVHMSIGTKY